MTKKFLMSISFLLCSAGIVKSQSLYQFSVNSIDDSLINLEGWAGKKTLIIIAPVNSSDSNLLNQLRQFQVRYGDTVNIIGVMSIEDSFISSNKTNIKNLYQEYNINIFLTAGMYSRKSSDQSALTKWLTDMKKNSHFDKEVEGIGHKFFVNETGRLFAVLLPAKSLDSPNINRIVHSNRLRQ